MRVAQKRPDRWLGPGNDIFWSWCDKEELRLQRCAHCSQTSWPVVEACEHCGSVDLGWDRMSGRGRLVSWSTFERDYYAGLIPVPYSNVIVELDEGSLFLSNPLGLTWRDFEPGMPMKVAFIECEDSAGFFKLPVFERA
jgi:uncharacterized OB-fold protein